MQKYINRIFQDNYKNRGILNINLNGRSLILTGKNGSGKTSLITDIFEKTNYLIVERKLADYESIKNNYDSWMKMLPTVSKGTSDYDAVHRTVMDFKKSLDKIKSGIQIEFDAHLEFYEKFVKRSAVLRMFKATRAAKINHADTARGIKTDQDKNKNEDVKNNFGNNLEQHLVNLKNRRSLALTEEGNVDLAKKINDWLDGFRSNLAYLLEDDSMKLEFDSSSLKFKICQNGKDPYTFQQLSSGYSAILDIYADLIMRSEYFETSPNELSGVVFIDEIDAHLHVSLQRLILPFFEKSFPGIQFIVTTHSPFILMSVNDAVIYDVGRNEQIEEDLSFYSYSSVMEGILGVSPTSRLLDDVVQEIAEISRSNNKNIDRLRLLIEKVDPVKDKLGDKAKAYYLAGKNTLADSEEGE